MESLAKVQGALPPAPPPDLPHLPTAQPGGMSRSGGRDLRVGWMMVKIKGGEIFFLEREVVGPRSFSEAMPVV